jgi:hypothetical protein
MSTTTPKTTHRELTLTVENPYFLTSFPNKCPKHWNVNSKFCNAKFLHACTAGVHPEFSHACDHAEFMSLFRSITKKISSLAITGDGDRTCIYRIKLLQCSLMNFWSRESVMDIVVKLLRLTREVSSSCGGSKFKSHVDPVIMKMMTLAGECEPSESTTG